MITHPRHIELQTAINGDVIVHIAAPRSAHGQKAAQSIQRRLEEQGARVETHDDPEESLLRSAKGPVIVVGNLADSRCIRELYYRSLCATDLFYPGPSGYELRTLCDPFGTGHNLILIGYSDADGVEAAGLKFQEQLGESIPHLKELHITQLPFPERDIDACRRGELPATATEIANTMQGDNIGYLYYMTGEPSLGENYKKAWQAVLSCGYNKTEDVVQSHLYSLWRFLPWRLVEDMDLFDDAERLAITQYFYGWAESEEGWRHVADCPRTQRPNNPRQNHELVPALALMHAADYFEAHFPTAPGPEKWREVGRTAFEPYDTSWKPLCDGLCHGWWMSQPIMLEYALLDPEHRYFAHGGARKAAECALAVINNDGWMPCAGDTDIKRQFPGPVLRIAADFYQDESFRFGHDLALPDRRFGWQTVLPRAFDSGVQPQKPQDQVGITVVPVDPLIYHVWEHEPELAIDTVTCPPSAPIEQCFDKLAVRSGWSLADDYLLIDGLGGGSHSYDDAGGIIEYARLGVSVIVQEDSFVHSAPEDHSLVTIVRNGETGIIPGFAILEEQQTDSNGTVYLRIRSKDYAGTDWVREVHLMPGKCAVFIDTVTANTAGDFAIEAHFRTPTRIALEGRVAQATRKSPCCEEVEIRLTSLSDPSNLSVAEVPLHLRYPSEVDQGIWRTRYRSDEMVLMSFDARETTYMQPGESVRMVHLAQARGPSEPLVDLGQDEESLFLVEGDSRTRLETFAFTSPSSSSLQSKSPTEAEELRLFFDARGKITAICLSDEDSLAVGTNSGTLSHVDTTGQAKWTADLDGPIHDIGVARGQMTLVAAGHGLADLTAFDTGGAPQWTSQIVHEPSPWPWWELKSPAPIQVSGGVTNGDAFFAVGCGDLQIRGFDHTGQKRWMQRYNEGVPGRVTVTDVDDSGNPSIVVGGEILSDQSTCRILTPDGKILAELPVEGWTSILTALSFGDDQNRRFIGCGANRGANLHLFEFIDDEWRRLWLKRPGGAVTGIVIQGSANRMVAATSQGFLLGYDLTGAQQWHLLFDQGLKHLVKIGEKMIAIDSTGGLRIVTLGGQVEKQLSLPGPCSLVSATDDAIYFVCDTVVWRYSCAHLL